VSLNSDSLDSVADSSIPRTADYEGPGIVWIQGSVHEARLGLGWLPGAPWAASVDDKGLRIIGVQSSVNLLGLKWFRLTFPKDPVQTHKQVFYGHQWVLKLLECEERSDTVSALERENHTELIRQQVRARL